MKKTSLIAAASLLAHVAVVALAHLAAANAQGPPPPAPQGASAAAPAESRRAGAITGRVVGEDGQPVADARVTVYAVNHTGLRSTSLTVTTDADGNFRADGLAPAAYAVSAYLPGYVTPRPDATYYRLGETANVTVRKGAAITGRVTDAGGEPVVGAVVLATLVRDESGRQPTIPSAGRAMMTDDRGVYRLYGLMPGVYVVMATGDSRYFYGNVSPLEGDVPTYYPSATRDDAGEVRVGAGEEISGIDIRHRGERGHVVSGKIIGQPVVELVPTPAGRTVESVGVLLIHAASGAVVGNAAVMLHEERRGFGFYGVPDGEYEVVASRRFAGRDGAASSPRRVTVKGGDVTGLELSLAPLGSVAGRVMLEPRAAAGGAECKPARAAAVEEALVTLRRDEPGRKPRASDFPLWLRETPQGSVDEKGEFVIRNLEDGNYRVAWHLPSESWYVRAATVAANKFVADAARGVLALKAGEKLTGLKVTVAEGAAALKGRVVDASNARPPARLRVHLIPAEREAADDVLRYGEVVAASGAFSFTNVAPGRYYLLARPEEESEGGPPRPPAWDAEARTRLRREAEAANVAVKLKPCQRVSDFELPYSRAN